MAPVPPLRRSLLHLPAVARPQGRGRLGGADGTAPPLLHRSHGYDPYCRPSAYPAVVANDLLPGVQITTRGESAYFPLRRGVCANPHSARGGDVRSRPDVGRGSCRARVAVAPHFSEPEHAVRRDGMDVSDEHDLRRHLSTYSRRSERKG